MNKSELFKNAHKVAKATVAIVGDYRIAFSLALKDLYTESKNVFVASKESMIELGGKLWEKGDMIRVYLNSDIFNKLAECRLGDNNNKFFYDVKTNCLMRSYKGKRPQVAVQY